MTAERNSHVEPKDLKASYLLPVASGADLADVVREALENAVGTAWIEGFGEVSDPVLVVANAEGVRIERSLHGVWDVTTLYACDAVRDGAPYVALSRDTGTGTESAAGQLVRGTVLVAALRVTAQGRAEVRVIPSTPGAETAPQARPAAPAPAPSSPGGGAPAPAPFQAQVPKKIVSREESFEVYPEEGDHVNHFAFGECVVVFSDGERLRLQQDKDSRVREVALSMLKLQPPTLDEAGKRHWELKRKN